MPAYYMGPPIGFGRQGGPLPGIPRQNQPPAPQAPTDTLGPQAIRPQGASQGFDPAYLQNLATMIGGLFAPQGGGGLNFNPLGNLSDIGGSSGMGGNAPLPGLPPTLAANAVGGQPFSFASPTTVNGLPAVTERTNPPNNRRRTGPVAL